MAHFAKIENNYVTSIIVVPDEHEHHGEKYLNELGLTGTWIQTSYNNNIRGIFAQVGGKYDSEKDIFIAVKPHESYYLDENYDWQPPVPFPNNGKPYVWDESTKSWMVSND